MATPDTTIRYAENIFPLTRDCSRIGGLLDLFLFAKAGVDTEKIDKGRILGGVKGYLEGMFRNPSLITIQGKTMKKKTKKYKN